MSTKRQSFTDPTKVETLNKKIYDRGYIDREHLMEFLSLIDTNDAQTIIDEVHKWLTAIHDDPTYSKITFREGDIDAIIGDLDSYGRVQPENILSYKQSSNRTLPLS